MPKTTDTQVTVTIGAPVDAFTPPAPKIPVTMTRNRHGDEEAHRTGCADLKRGHHRHFGDHADIGTYSTAEQVAAEWFQDMIEEGSGTAAEYVAHIHFAPCLDGLV